MKNSSFYLDVEKMARRRLFCKLTVRLNGKRMSKVIACKTGNHGFVEYLLFPLRLKDGEAETIKKRGVVRLSIDKSQRS